MNQLILSNDLNIITAEINSFKQVAGQAVFEIGKRLKHVKENDLAHGQFEKWLEVIGIHERQAQRFMRIATELDVKATTWSDLPFRALYEIATMPEEEREEKHIVPSSGELRTPNEMSVRELQEVKQALKAAQQESEAAGKRATQAEAARQLAINQHSAQQDKLLEQIEKLKQQKGRSPEDEARLKELSKQNVDLTQTLHKLQDELQERNSATEKRSHDLRKMKESLSKTSAYVIVDLSTALMHFRSINDQKEAIEVAERFWVELEETLSKKRAEWQEYMQINISEVNHDGNGTTRTEIRRQAIIIDANTEA